MQSENRTNPHRLPAGLSALLRAGLALALLLALTGCGGQSGAAPTAQASVQNAAMQTDSTPAPEEMPEQGEQEPADGAGKQSDAQAQQTTPAPTAEPIPLTAFVPDFLNETLVSVETVIPEDTPNAILDELIRLEAVPDIDFGRNVYFEVGDSYIKEKGGKQRDSHVARLDVSGRLLDALAEGTLDEENLFLQAMANTFLTHYNAETFMLTTDGDKLETTRRDYERGFQFDQYARTARQP